MVFHGACVHNIRAREEFLQAAASHAGTVVERASEEPIRDAGDEGTEFAL
jgi:hypothetical protein